MAAVGLIMHRIFLLFLLAATSCFAQFSHLRLGVKGGGYFTNFYSTKNNSIASSSQYAVGPSAEYFFRKDMSIEVNALYRPVTSKLIFPMTDGFHSFNGEAKSWEVPILFKKYFGEGAVRPFAGIGPSFRRLYGQKNDWTCFGCGEGGGLLDSRPSDATSIGGTVAAGVELPRFGPRWTVEFRYSLFESSYSGPGAKENQHQAGVFLGITF